MAFKTLVLLAALAVGVSAAPSPQAICSQGRRASNAAVCYFL